jgi:O-methyltransferase involved in polyketide biosynthesis
MVIDSAARLSTVSKTLFLTLQARAHETEQPNGLFVDSEAARILQAFGHALRQTRADWITHVGIVMRADIYDRETRRYLASARPPLVINLGAGLCTRYFRLGQPAVDWIEIDFPDVIALRRSLLPESAQHRTIACSVTDHAWIDQIPCAAETRPLFIAEGLLWYLSDSEVKELLIALNRRFPGGRVLTEAPSPLCSALYRRHPLMGNIGIRYHHGTVGSQRQLDRWSRGISFEEEWLLYDHHPERWRWLAFWRHLPGLREWGKSVSLRLNGDELGSNGVEQSGLPVIRSETSPVV